LFLRANSSPMALLSAAESDAAGLLSPAARRQLSFAASCGY
jgi:hypothetical protein